MPYEHAHHFHLTHQQVVRRQQQRADQWQRRALAGDEALSPRVEAPYAPAPFEDHRAVPARAVGGDMSQMSAAGVVTPRDDPQALRHMGFNSARAERGMSNSLMTAGMSALGSHSKSTPDPFKSPAKKMVLSEDLSDKDLQPLSPQVEHLRVRDLTTDGRALGFVYPTVKGHERMPVLDAIDLPPMSERFARTAAMRVGEFKTTRAIL
eukprot:gnl/MRDRNA2_/MRDRNA2_108409_c0_seq1.p1 gnl/MRDRNA2_/MRDRNA2_108409_c0~~gnl/MRDRNA2_/MRDRNA2_108409_c0_seq1.p1  ORF type:complete len:208 (-),score=39.35 gnl/MRDRNA2_/MRDRNA2_108409_c0_seq1:85-708(-)